MTAYPGKEDPMPDNDPHSGDIISSLPLADIPIPGVSARLLQAEGKQVLFMEFRESITVSEHAHEAQWGVVLAGQLELTMNGRKQVLKKGDSYYIPRGVPHEARYSKGFRDVMVFDQPDRYKPRTD